MSSTRTSQFVKASPAQVYEAFMDPKILMEWLPPAEMTGVMHEFDGQVGGGYRMSLHYAADVTDFAGKTADHEDQVTSRFLDLEPPHRIVQATSFVTDDPALKGEMTMITTIEAAPGGSLVTMVFENIPPGLKPEDNDAGARESLGQLARRFA